jgi:hypothetical protein
MPMILPIAAAPVVQLVVDLGSFVREFNDGVDADARRCR